jgi:hypothetical protein
MAEVWNFRTRRTYKIYYINFSLLWFCKLGNRLLLIIFRSVYHFQAAGFCIKSDKALSAVTVEHNIKENFSTRGFNICCLVDLVRDKLRPVQESTSRNELFPMGEMIIKTNLVVLSGKLFLLCGFIMTLWYLHDEES